MQHQRLRGLYAITTTVNTPEHTLSVQVENALQGGARVIQYRDKRGDGARRRAEAMTLLHLCRQHGVPLIINDDLALAQEINADGVHLGKDDLTLTEARARLGADAIIGVSCYNRLDLAEAAAGNGASYIAFGRFFPSRSKPDATPASLETLRQARQRLRLPIVAIGGITPENGPALIAAGADMLAVIHGVFGQPDIQAACRRFSQLFATD